MLLVVFCGVVAMDIEELQKDILILTLLCNLSVQILTIPNICVGL
jgi:hypothetical protein